MPEQDPVQVERTQEDILCQGIDVTFSGRGAGVEPLAGSNVPISPSIKIYGLTQYNQPADGGRLV